MEETPVRVTLTEPDVAGSYVVAEKHADGSLLLTPETSEEVIERFAGRPLDADEAVASLRRLHEAALREEG